MNCTFPAKELVREMQKHVAMADAARDPVQTVYGCGFVKAINDLRLTHEDMTGCTCWYDALREEASHDRRP